MSKILPATCSAGVVTVDSLPVSATILSEGVAQSSGIAIIEGEDVTYIAKISPDLKTTLGKIADALTQLVTALTAIDAKPLGALPPAPAAATQIAQLTAINVEVTALKEALK